MGLTAHCRGNLYFEDLQLGYMKDLGWSSRIGIASCSTGRPVSVCLVTARQLLLHRALHSGSEAGQHSSLHPRMTFLSAENKHLSQHHQQSHPHSPHSLPTSQPINKLSREAFIEGGFAINPPPDKPVTRYTALQSISLYPPFFQFKGREEWSGSSKSNVMVSANDKVQAVNF